MPVACPRRVQSSTRRVRCGALKEVEMIRAAVESLNVALLLLDSRSFFIVKGGTFNREELYRIMVEEPAQYEGCSGCRSFSDVESDLKAQIAANHKGAQLIGKLIKEYGLPTVHAYMDFIRDNAELAIRELLKRTAATYGTKLSALDHMDDGSPIALEITIDPADGSAVFDFEGAPGRGFLPIGASKS